MGGVLLDPIPAILLNNPPCIMVEFCKFVSLAPTIILPIAIAFWAVLGASVNGSVVIAASAVSELL